MLKESFRIFLKRPGSLAAGIGNEVPETTPEYVFLRKNHINAEADGIALVDGKSMEPVYHSGDYVYYMNATSADPGEDVLVDTEEGAVIKRVGEDYTLYSVNPAVPYPKKTQLCLIQRNAIRILCRFEVLFSVSYPLPICLLKQIELHWKSCLSMRFVSLMRTMV